MEILPVGAELFYAKDGRRVGGTDGRTDMKKLTVTFRNFANDPRNDVLFLPFACTHTSL